MKIVNFEEFIRMPAGTMFAPYQPCILEKELAIKVDEGKPAPNYCMYTHIFNGVLPLRPYINVDETTLFDPGDEEAASFETYDGDNNDYSDYAMFLVFDEEDIDRLIKVLEWAKGGCEGPNPGDIYMN